MEGTKMPLTKALLNLIYATGQVAVDFYYITHDAKYHRAAFARGGHEYVEELKGIKRKRIYNCLHQLKRSKFITINKIQNQLLVSLTDKGKQSNLISNLKQSKVNNNKYTIVIFDIPQSHNNIRKKFRRILKQSEFYKLQQSVWAINKDAYKILKIYIKETNLTNWVNIFYGYNLLNKNNHKFH